MHIGKPTLLIGWVCLALSFSACQSEYQREPRSFGSGVPVEQPPTVVPEAVPPTETIVPPSSMATPTMIDISDIQMREDFSGTNSCIESFDNERASAALQDGAFVLEVHLPDEIVSANCETLVVSDFSMEVDINVAMFEPGGVYYFGVLLRVSGDERYAFVIGSEGGYCVYYAKDEAFVPLTSSTDFGVQCWTHLPQSAKQEGTQRLRVEALAERIDVYLNDELLAVVRDGQLRSGWVGFVAATAGEGGLQVVFDNLVISRK